MQESHDRTLKLLNKLVVKYPCEDVPESSATLLNNAPQIPVLRRVGCVKNCNVFDELEVL
jgi:hypothetical protein